MISEHAISKKKSASTNFKRFLFYTTKQNPLKHQTLKGFEN